MQAEEDAQAEAQAQAEASQQVLDMLHAVLGVAEMISRQALKPFEHRIQQRENGVVRAVALTFQSPAELFNLLQERRVELGFTLLKDVDIQQHFQSEIPHLPDIENNGQMLALIICIGGHPDGHSCMLSGMVPVDY